MKLLKFLIIIISISFVFAQNSNNFNQNENYLGFAPPGNIPEVFAPGVISTDKMELYLSFSKDYSMILFFRDTGEEEIFYITRDANGWKKPKHLPYENEKLDGYFILPPHKSGLYFSSLRPLSADIKKEESRKLWYMNYVNHEWQKPQLVDFLLDSDNFIGHPSFANDGTIYFYDAGKKGLDQSDIFSAKLIDGNYKKVYNPGPNINTAYNECDAFISPDESFMIFACNDHPDIMGDFDLFISFKKEDGSWTKYKTLGPTINSTGREIYPRVSPDGKYIFFGSNRNGNWDIYWVKSDIINNIRKKELKE